MASHSAMASVIGAGLMTHFIFKKTETHEPLHLFLLLLVLPAASTVLFVPHTSSLVSAVAATFTLFWTTLGISVVGYRLSPWHPLADYPGPVMYKITKLWPAVISLGGKQHEYYRRLHTRYGNIVRVGPNELSIVESAAIQPLMGSNGLPKGPLWDGRFPEGEAVKTVIAIRNKAEHTRRRRPWTRAFSSIALRDYESFVTSRCAQLVEAVGRQNGVVDLRQWISYFSWDVMNDLAFGGGTEMIRDGDVDGLWDLHQAGQKIAMFMGHVPWFGALFYRLPSLGSGLKSFRAFTKVQAGNRIKNGSPRKDIFYYLNDEDDSSSTPPNILEVINDGVTAILAGSDTTSNTISNLFFLLLTHPEKYKRLQAEVDQVGRDIMDFGNLAQMPYLNAAINETLRFYPAVLSGSQRYTNVGSGGRLIGDKYIPECTSVFVPHYTLHHDPRYFSPLPDSFIPERWLSPEEQIKLEPELFENKEVILDSDCFMPFSLGPSSCVGKSLAMMEMRMVVGLLVKKYDMKLMDGYRPEEWDEKMLDYLLMRTGELPVVLTERT